MLHNITRIYKYFFPSPHPALALMSPLPCISDQSLPPSRPFSLSQRLAFIVFVVSAEQTSLRRFLGFPTGRLPTFTAYAITFAVGNVYRLRVWASLVLVIILNQSSSSQERTSCSIVMQVFSVKH